MRNPWVHDDVPDGSRSGYGGRVRLLGGIVWGTLLLGVAGAALLIGTGAVDPALTGWLQSAVTYVIAGAAAVLLFPLVLRLLAVSRLLATVAFLGTGWLIGRFVWSREAGRIERLAPSGTGLGADGESLNGLIELMEALLSVL